MELGWKSVILYFKYMYLRVVVYIFLFNLIVEFLPLEKYLSA